jgi:hypothetical protein
MPVAAPPHAPAPRRHVVADDESEAPANTRRGHAAIDAVDSSPAVLRVETEDGSLARVTLDGERKDAPGARFQRPAGKYLVVLVDRDGDSHTCPVELIEGRTRTLTVETQTGACHFR